MKKILLFASAAIALASCSSDELIGGYINQSESNAIGFGAQAPNTTRAVATVSGDQAAKKLNNKFNVYGWKTNTNEFGKTDGDVEDVYQDYQMKWSTYSQDITESNKTGWEYVGLMTEPLNGEAYSQTIKYWDYSTHRYDFIAWSINEKSNAILKERTTVTRPDATTPVAPSLTFNAPTAKDLAYIYISDKLTAKPKLNDVNYPTPDGLTNAADHSNIGEYQANVNLRFRNLAAKVRIGLYETVPGYEISDVVFYNAAEATTTENLKGPNNNPFDYTYKVETGDYRCDQSHATLYSDAAIFGLSGDVTVKYHDATYESGDLKKDNTAYTTTQLEKQSFFAFGQLTNKRGTEDKLGAGEYIGTSSNTASMSIGNDDNKLYTYVFPMEDNEKDLNLKVNYVLTSKDNSSEKIRVVGANATIPAKYAKWMSNYAYTYLFKISDNTNGSTGTGAEPAGLYPITFDAVVIDAQDGIQETVTTLEDHSLTTYQYGSKVTVNDVYTEDKGTIYVVDEDGKANVTDGTADTKLYVAQAFNGATITEAALQNKAKNGIVLTDITANLTDATEIPALDGHTIAMNCVKFTPKAGYTYVIEHKYTDGGVDKLAYKVIKVQGDVANAIVYKFYDDDTTPVEIDYNYVIDENDSRNASVKATYNNDGNEYVVTGAAGAFEFYKGTKKITVAETATPGTYTFSAAPNAWANSVSLGGQGFSIGVRRYKIQAVSGDSIIATNSDGSDGKYIELKLGDDAYNTEKTLVIKDQLTGEDVPTSDFSLTWDSSSHKYLIKAHKAGDYIISCADFASTQGIHVHPYALAFADKYVNLNNSTVVNLSNAAATNEVAANRAKLNRTLTVIGATVATDSEKTNTSGVANIKPTSLPSNRKLTVKFEEAEATITVMNFTLADGNEKGEEIYGTIQGDERYVWLKENGAAYKAGNGELTADGGATITPTSEKGLYKISKSATVTYKYHGVEMVSEHFGGE